MAELILPLHGDNLHNDSHVIRHLLQGGAAFDVRTQNTLVAPTIALLPTGLYLLTPHLKLQHTCAAN